MTPAEAGLLAIAELGPLPAPPEEAVRFHWPKCTLCRRRPTMMVRPGTWLRFRTGLSDGPEFYDVPRYEILPCCSSKYLENRLQTTASKRQMRQAGEIARLRHG